MVTLVAVVWFGRETWLRGAAELWIVSDELGPADAVAVLGGAINTRPKAAAEYYHQGLVKKVLIAEVGLDDAELLGAVPSHTAMNRAVLIHLGVPATAIENFGRAVKNSYQEVTALREWAEQNNARYIIVPTQDFTARRIRWVIARVFAGSGTRLLVVALHPPEYDYREWWRSDSGLLAFQNEMIKYVYYRFKY